MLVVLVVSERREASACLIMLSTKQGSHWYSEVAFIEPLTHIMVIFLRHNIC